MARRKPKSVPEFSLFNIEYEDGKLSSNRRVHHSEFPPGMDVIATARAVLAAQDREVSEKSGLPPRTIKSVVKVGKKKKAA